MTQSLSFPFKAQRLVWAMMVCMGSAAANAAQPPVLAARTPAPTASEPGVTGQGAPAASLAEVLQTIAARSPDILAAQAGQNQAQAQVQQTRAAWFG